MQNMFSLGKAKSSPRTSQTSNSFRVSQMSKEKEIDDGSSVISACSSLDSLSIRITRLDAEFAIASRRTAAVESMVANAERWLERRLDDYGDRLLASWQEHLEARVTKIVHQAIPATLSSSATSCDKERNSQPAQQKSDLEANSKHDHIILNSTHLIEANSKPQRRKRPAAKRVRRSAISNAMKDVSDKLSDQAQVENRASDSEANDEHDHITLNSMHLIAADSKPRRRKRPAVKRVRRSATSKGMQGVSDKPSDQGQEENRASESSSTNVSDEVDNTNLALKQVSIQCNSKAGDITSLVATPPLGVVAQALIVILAKSNAGLTHEHETILKQLPKLAIAVMSHRCSEEDFRGCENPIANRIAAMVKWFHEAQCRTDIPVAVVIDGVDVGVSVDAALASGVVTGITVLNAKHLVQSAFRAANSAGVHLLLPDSLEDLTAWLSKMPQLARLS